MSFNMPKRTSRPVQPPATVAQLLELEARLGVLEAMQPGIGADANATNARLLELHGELLKTRDLALEGLAQSQDALEARQLARSHEDRLTNLTLAVAEGIAHVERAEARIRATVQRARAQLAEAGIESPALEAEGDQLQLLDEGGSGGRKLHAVREDVEPPDPGPRLEDRADDGRPSLVPGMTRGQLRRFRGA